MPLTLFSYWLDKELEVKLGITESRETSYLEFHDPAGIVTLYFKFPIEDLREKLLKALEDYQRELDRITREY